MTYLEFRTERIEYMTKDFMKKGFTAEYTETLVGEIVTAMDIVHELREHEHGKLD